MKKQLIVVSIIAIAISLAACGGKSEPQADAGSQEQAEKEADAMTTASIVNDKDAFLQAVGKSGTWIIAVLQDLSFDQEVVVAGEFSHRDEIYRKLALYSQDEDRNITDRYTVTAPRFTIQSPNTRLQGGTLAGDVYVQADSFHIVDGTVNGDIYFSTPEYRDSFSLQDGAEVTGELIVE